MIQRMLAIWSLVPLPLSKSSLNIWKFVVHVLLNPGLENFEHYFASMGDECNCAVVWAFFGIAFLWDWNENWPFSVLWPLLSFPNFLAYRVQHFHKGFGVVNKAEVDIFLEISSFFNDPKDVGNLISGSSVFLNPVRTYGSSWFTYCWSLAWRLLSITLHQEKFLTGLSTSWNQYCQQNYQ